MLKLKIVAHNGVDGIRYDKHVRYLSPKEAVKVAIAEIKFRLPDATNISIKVLNT